MDITLPAIPAGITTLLALLAPYAISALNGALPFVTKTWQRKAVAVAVSLLLSAAVILGYFWTTGDVVPDWPTLILLAIVVSQTSYALVTRDLGAKAIEESTTVVVHESR